MSITYEEIGGSNGQARSSTQDELRRRTYVRYFQATTDDARIGAGQVRAGCGVSIGDRYQHYDEWDDGSFAVRITATEDSGEAADGCGWLVTVEYGPFDAAIMAPADPIVARPRIQFSSSRFQRIPTVDVDDEPVVNSAGDPFDPPLTIDASRPFLTIARNERTYRPILANDYKDTINDAPWFGMPEFAWKCLDITADEQYDQENEPYWIVTYQFELNPDTWIIPVLDVGMRQLDPATAKKVRILDDASQPVATPWPLNEDGSRKPTGTPAEKILFHIYPEMDFAVLDLDDFYDELISSGRLA